MTGLRTIFILCVISAVAVKVDCNYKDRRKGEKADPAGVETEDISVVLKDGEETVAEEKALDKKLDELDRRLLNGTNIKIEVKIQEQQRKMEARRKRIKIKSQRLTESVERRRRFIRDEKNRQWTKAIVPYVMTHVSLNDYQRNEIKKVMKLYEHYTCFRFVEWDNTTQTKYGLDHNNYIYFMKDEKGGCWSYVGNLRKTSGGQALSCCTGSTCVHEIGHALGFSHEQSSPYSKDVLRINKESIQEDYRGQYSRSSSFVNLRDFPYDLNSVMHYKFWMFNNGNGPTMTVFNPKLRYLVNVGSLAHFYFFKEMTIVYGCKEMKCPEFKLKCENTGYVAYIEGKCRCRCPTGLDPETGCTTVKSNTLDKTLKWPSSQFALLRPANAQCPENSKEGSITHNSDGGFTNDNYQAMGDHENLHFCTFDHQNRTADAKMWPSGEYCLTKVGGSCPKKGCPFGWTLNEENNHCYKHSSMRKTFNDAAKYCTAQKGYLAIIDDEAENEFVRKLITIDSYIGADDQKTEGTFVGPDEKELKYTNWDTREPDNWNNNEDCAALKNSNGKWTDIGCWYSYYFVCEMPLPGFKEGYMEFEDDSVTHKGTLPDVMSGGKTKLEFCCRDDGNNAVPIVMPTANKFILWQTNREGCQRVRDTIAVSNHFAYRMKPGKIATVKGTTPLGSIDNNLAYAYFCVYQPVSKDCGQIIELTDEDPTAVVTSPYYPHSYHANMECTWLIKSKKNTRLVLTFEKFEITNPTIACDDFLEIRYSLPGQPGRKYCGHEFKTSVYSFENYMSLILNSKSFRHGKKFKGTITMIRDEDLCYYGPDKGASYRGTVNFSRNFKACLPWNETTHCVHSPKNTNDAFSGLDGNYCRNPSSGTHPWCYTESNGCIRDYCDVCGLGNCHDYDISCAEHLKKDPNYCKNTAAWYGLAGCAKTCGQCDEQTKKKYAELSCKNPPIPKGVTQVDPTASSTQVGKTVDYYYPTNKNNIFALMCYSDGSWSQPSVCPYEWTLDQDTKKCNKVVKSTVNGRYFAELICRKHGGFLGVITNEKENNFTTNLVQQAGRKALIDLTDKLKEGTHIWTNGETSTYRNWNEDEPNNWSNQDCTFLTQSGKWDDLNCQQEMSGILCQIPLPVSYCRDGTTKCEKFRKLKNVALGKPSKQSSDYSSKVTSEKAVDGKTDEGCTHTKTEDSPWWEVDLEKVYKIKSLVIVSSNPNGWRVKNINITIGELPTEMKECVFFEGAAKNGEYVELQCSSPIFGRYVKIQKMSRGILQMAEVFVYAYTDIAEITCPKLTLPADAKPVGELLSSHTAGHVVRYYFDVNEDNVFSRTCLSTGQWTELKVCPEGWVLNAATKKCNKVFVQSVSDGYAGEEICRTHFGYMASIKDKAENDFVHKLVNRVSTNALIGYSDKLKENSWVWSNEETSTYTNWDSGEPNNYNNQDCALMNTAGTWEDLYCKNTFKAVVCQIPLPVNSCEDGSTVCDRFKKLKNVAQGKPTKQSSDYSSNVKSEKAVDGKTDEGCTHTQTEDSPWWEVDLQSVYKIKKILIVNSFSNGWRLKNIKITIGELKNEMKDCTMYEGAGKDGEYVELQCATPIIGRYVKLQKMTRGILQMAEVFVYAYAHFAEVTCPKLKLPAFAVLQGEMLPKYTAGTVAKYYFSLNDNNIFSLTCLSTGSWTKIRECPDGWTLDTATKKCNRVIVKTFVGQYAGEEICRTYWGNMASIIDETENDVVYKLVKFATKSAVIGYNDKLKENTWVWSSGNASTYTRWDSGEPNNYNNQDCAVMNTKGKWEDLYCMNTFYAVACQIPIPVATCKDGTTNCEKFEKLKNVALGKPSKQSSDYSSKVRSEKAVDGKTDDGCTHTNTEDSAWWEVDLGRVYKIKKLLIANCYSNELKNEMKECTMYEGAGKDSEYVELQCATPIFGRYVRIQKMTRGILQIAEVFVYAYANIPEVTCPKLKLPALATLQGEMLPKYTAGTVAKYYFIVNDNNIYSLSCLSTGSWTNIQECPDGWILDAATKKCNRVIEKTFSGQYAGEEICRTYFGNMASIKDKAENDFIHKLVHYAGKKAVIGYSDKLKEKKWVWSNGEVSTYTRWLKGEPNDYSNQDCAVMNTDGTWWDQSCTTTFQAVVCQISVPVHTCQDGTTKCEKFKTYKNVARGKPTKQSSDYSSKVRSGNAVDGKVDDGCTHTRWETNPWWEVDLGKVYKIKKILIVNSLSNGWRLQNIKVTIGELKSDIKECAYYEGSGKDGEYVELQCPSPIFGRYLKLQKFKKGILQITEVFVYADTDIPEITCPKLTLPPNAQPVGIPPPSNTMATVARYYFTINEDNIFARTCLSNGSWTKIRECPNGWIHNAATKKCNKVIKQSFTGRYNGDLICRQNSGHVAMIKDQAENEFMRNLVANVGTNALIDAMDRLKEGTWVYSNGEAATYVNWLSGEPNNWRNQDCAILPTSGKWWDVGCMTHFKAVACQIDLPVGSCKDGTTNCDKFIKLENVAQGKAAKQSSTYSTDVAGIAVDGTLKGMSHTRYDSKPWWQVDLGKVYPVKKILIVNRMHNHGTRLRNLKVTIGKTEDGMKDCVFLEGPGHSSEYIELRCSTPLSGQFVKLQMTSAGFLQLTEVYVYTPVSDKAELPDILA